jgi:pimeloyl-ACP methyl ester carboxylesterase
MKKILCLNGWGQEPKTLENAFKKVFKDADISTIDYFDTNLSKTKILTDYDIVIGWSYGSQQAIKLIKSGFLKTKLLILIAPIFQFVENEINKVGMPVEAFYAFLSGFNKHPEATMQHLVAMSASGDENSNLVFDKMKTQDLNVLSKYALEQQLLVLKEFSCFDINFKKFPKTICFSGANDAVVASTQTKLFAERIKDFELHIIENCGHAPHFSHMEEIKERLKNVL